MIAATRTAPELASGLWVCYTGDVANPSGVGRIVRENPPSRFEARGSVDLRLDDGRLIRGLTSAHFNRTSPGCRFVMLGEWRATRRARLLELKRSLGGAA